MRGVSIVGLVGVMLLVPGCGSDDGGAPSSGGAAGGGAAGSGATASGGTGGGSGGSGGAGTGGTATGGAAGNGGPSGIASNYPGDVGIASDPDVLFHDDFESYADAKGIPQKWDHWFQQSQTRIATEAQNVSGGKQSLEFKVPQQNGELSNSVAKELSPPRDVLFLRYYSKFQAPFDVVGSSHNGSSISSKYFINGQATPGVPADGSNKFLANLENWRGDAATPSPGHLNVYLYHPEQRSQWGDHFFPTGKVLPNSSQPFDFGPTFTSRPDFLPNLDQWYCYEFMVQANTPGSKDGRITFWVDGKLVGDLPGLRLRDVDTLKIDRFGLDFHIGSNPNGETRKWYDDVVAATKYIGPKS